MRFARGVGSPCSRRIRTRRVTRPHVASRGEAVVCRRCYRINHYGVEDLPVKVDEEDVWAMVLDVVDQVDVCLMVVDIVDFEGCYLPRLASAAKRLLVGCQQGGLAAHQDSPGGGRRLGAPAAQGRRHFAPRRLPHQRSKGFGMRALLEAAKGAAGRKARWGWWARPTWAIDPSFPLVERDGRRGHRFPFPGTTLGSHPERTGASQLEIVDTPGLTTRGRLTTFSAGPARRASSLKRRFPANSSR